MSHPLRSIGQFFKDNSRSRKVSFFLGIDPNTMPVYTKGSDSDDSEEASPGLPQIPEDLKSYMTPAPSSLRDSGEFASFSLLSPSQLSSLNHLTAQVSQKSELLSTLLSLSSSLHQAVLLTPPSQSQSHRLQALESALASLHTQQ